MHIEGFSTWRIVQQRETIGGISPSRDDRVKASRATTISNFAVHRIGIAESRCHCIVG